MKKTYTLLKGALVMLVAITLNYGCSKSSKEVEIPGPSETIVLDMVNVSNLKVGELHLENIAGKARASLSMNNGYYTAGNNLKTNFTVTDQNGVVVFANCKDMDGNTGKCTTYPITTLSNGSDALYEHVVTMNGLVFNVLDANNNVFARSAKHTIVIDN